MAKSTRGSIVRAKKQNEEESATTPPPPPPPPPPPAPQVEDVDAEEVLREEEEKDPRPMSKRLSNMFGVSNDKNSNVPPSPPAAPITEPPTERLGGSDAGGDNEGDVDPAVDPTSGTAPLAPGDTPSDDGISSTGEGPGTSDAVVGGAPLHIQSTAPVESTNKGKVKGRKTWAKMTEEEKKKSLDAKLKEVINKADHFGMAVQLVPVEKEGLPPLDLPTSKDKITTYVETIRTKCDQILVEVECDNNPNAPQSYTTEELKSMTLTELAALLEASDG